MNEQLQLMDATPVAAARPNAASYADLAAQFCQTSPHRHGAYGKRNWGGLLHSLCSYQGKLKPSIAHFLVSWFSNPGDVVLDPMAGVGTIPYEARRLGRVGVGNDLSPLAHVVSSAKLEPVTPEGVAEAMSALTTAIEQAPPLHVLRAQTDVTWGLNGSISNYFHPDTLRELLAAREHFMSPTTGCDAATNVLRASVLHILHGNRPYALSRRSHPVTPLSPTGEFEYKPLLRQLGTRLERVVPELVELAKTRPDGLALLGDFRTIGVHEADAIITSPPFARSLRFWSSNWMRLWFAGWEPGDFKTEPARYLETEQRSSYEPYREFAVACASSLKPGGRLILHLGETPKENMAERIAPLLAPDFEVIHIGRENVEDTESHGLTDKGATVAHWYLFAERQ